MEVSQQLISHSADLKTLRDEEIFMSDEKQHDQIHVRVSFPISKRGLYESEVSPGITVGTVLAAVMHHFEVQNDLQFTYVLTHDGLEESDSLTVGSVAGNTREVRFNLVKKITQG